MQHTFNGSWLRDYTLDEAANAILTGRNLSEFITSRPRLLDLQDLLFEDSLSILDFGCGMGRCCVPGGQNRPYWTFLGYDNPKMLGRVNEVYRKIPPNVTFTDDWNAVQLRGSQGDIDIVYAELVLQHIPKEFLHQYLAEFNTFLCFSKRADASLIIHGRRVLDDLTTPLWPIVLEYFDLHTSYDVPAERVMEGGPHDHFCCRFTPKDL